MRNKILIVEKEVLMLYFLKHRLRKEDFDVDIAVDGREAMLLISQNQYDAVIVDLTLPFMSGFELIFKIRTSENNFATPILVLSALSDENAIVDAMGVGANEFLKKPFATKVLLAVVNKMVSGYNLMPQVYGN
ncbi:DNA-binding response OmpR family regulator [Pedobacter sp. CAN_A7]|uniref:response regulator transcription factor n=1 Tax=Pedobacter sp. CAN_A7 TaxID=2787722 RepID=UPI0018C92A56